MFTPIFSSAALAPESEKLALALGQSPPAQICPRDRHSLEVMHAHLALAATGLRQSIFPVCDIAQLTIIKRCQGGNLPVPLGMMHELIQGSLEKDKARRKGHHLWPDVR